MDQPAIHRVKHLDLSFEPWVWPFAEDNRDDIATFFAQQRALKPQLFNGPVFLMRDPRIDDERLSGRYFQTDFASFLRWRALGFPDSAVYGGFGLGALRDPDGVFVMGEMAAHTANAGRVYFASGTPDPSDLKGDRVDIAGSITREVFEETGLTTDDYIEDDGFVCVRTAQAVAIFRVLHLKQPAAVVKARIEKTLRGEALAEFSAIHLVRDMRDAMPTMPGYVTAFLQAMTGDASR